MIGRAEVTEQREDMSRFMIHLTRDDSGESDEGQTAKKNFLDIYNQRTVLAVKPHCLYAKKVIGFLRSKFNVACFSEMPLTAIKHITQPIAGRQIQSEPFGFVFKREFLIGKGAQQVIYVNSYDGNCVLQLIGVKPLGNGETRIQSPPHFPDPVPSDTKTRSKVTAL